MTRGTCEEVGVAALLVALGGVVVAVAMTIPPGVQTDPLGPRVFPGFLGAGIAVCGVLLGVGTFAFRGHAAGSGPLVGAEPEEMSGPFSPGRLMAAILATAAYLAAFEPVGYLLSTPAYVAAILAIHGGASRLAWMSAPIVVTAALYGAFRFGLHIPVPLGVLETVLPW